jgi:hypothetical protein
LRLAIVIRATNGGKIEKKRRYLKAISDFNNWNVDLVGEPPPPAKDAFLIEMVRKAMRELANKGVK